MKVVKINAIWCSGCLVMNKTWNNILKTKQIETINLDYDMDSEIVKKYNPGEVLPVLIFFDDNNKELNRVVGEKSEKKLLKIIEELGD